MVSESAIRSIVTTQQEEDNRLFDIAAANNIHQEAHSRRSVKLFGVDLVNCHESESCQDAAGRHSATVSVNKRKMPQDDTLQLPDNVLPISCFVVDDFVVHGPQVTKKRRRSRPKMVCDDQYTKLLPFKKRDWVRSCDDSTLVSKINSMFSLSLFQIDRCDRDPYTLVVDQVIEKQAQDPLSIKCVSSFCSAPMEAPQMKTMMKSQPIRQSMFKARDPKA